MKKMKLLLFSVLALVTSSTFAQSRSFTELQTIAKKTLANSDNVYLADVKTTNGDTICYTFKGEKGGYAIVSADTRVPALLAYSNDGEIYPELQEMLDVFVQNIDDNQHENMTLSQSAESELRATRITDAPIEPLLKDIAWGQYAPFNLNAPLFDTKNAPVGCVATAVAQILYYYRYPAATLSDIPAYTTATGKIKVAGVEKGIKLDWDNMMDSYLNGYTDTSAKAISDLFSVVDAAVEMDFGKEESSSTKICAKELVEVFGYDQDLIRISYRSSYTFKEWSHIIYNELKEKRPVLMGGQSMSGGHRFLCDGIDKNGLFHINWGWNGSRDGYYDLAILNPNTTTEAGSSKTTDGYSKDIYIVYGIQPDNGVADASDRKSVIDALSVRCQTSNGKYFLFFSYANNSFEAKKVQLANGYIDEDGNVVNIGSIGTYNVAPQLINVMKDARELNVSTFEEGKTYKVCLIESEDGEHWTPCEGYENVSCTFSVKGGVVSFIDKYELSASVEMVDFIDTDQFAHGTIHLKNTGTQEYYKYIYLMINTTEERPDRISYASYITVEAGDSSDVDFKFVPQSDSVYFWLLNADKSVLDSGIVYKENKVYSLDATVRIDTTATGDLICRLIVKNVGNAYYDNLVNVALNYVGGFYSITPELYLKPGDSTIVSSYIPNEFDYTRYSVYDCYGDLIVFDNMNGGLANSGEVTVNFTTKKYMTSDQTVVGNLVISNGTSEPHVATYIIELDTSAAGSFEGVRLASFDVDAAANSSENIPFSLYVGRDTCRLIVYREGELRKTRYTMYAQYDGRTDIEELAAAESSKIKIWTMVGSVVAEAIGDAQLRISTIDGRILVSRRLHKGDIFRQDFPSAIYIVNGKKILVR